MWSAYPDRDGTVDESARPGLAPPQPPGLDPVELVVDGEAFVVTRQHDTPGTYHFTWTTGPHPYGFTMGGPADWTPDRAELIEEIRDFLAEINPETGYLD